MHPNEQLRNLKVEIIEVSLGIPQLLRLFTIEYTGCLRNSWPEDDLFNLGLKCRQLATRRQQDQLFDALDAMHLNNISSDTCTGSAEMKHRICSVWLHLAGYWPVDPLVD